MKNNLCILKTAFALLGSSRGLSLHGVECRRIESLKLFKAVCRSEKPRSHVAGLHGGFNQNGTGTAHRINYRTSGITASGDNGRSQVFLERSGTCLIAVFTAVQ